MLKYSVYILWLDIVGKDSGYLMNKAPRDFMNLLIISNYIPISIGLPIIQTQRKMVMNS